MMSLLLMFWAFQLSPMESEIDAAISPMFDEISSDNQEYFAKMRMFKSITDKTAQKLTKSCKYKEGTVKDIIEHALTPFLQAENLSSNAYKEKLKASLDGVKYRLKQILLLDDKPTDNK